MNIFYDNIIYFLQKSGGISRYWHELTSFFMKDEHIDMTFIEHPEATPSVIRESLDIKPENIIYEPSLPLKVSRYLPLFMNLKSDGIFHSSYYRDITDKRVKKIVTVHDFTYEHYIKGIKKTVHSVQKNYAVKKADGIICISENTKKDLMKFCPATDPDKITVIHNGVSDGFFPYVGDIDEIYEKTDLKPDNYTIFVGERSGYKNFETAVKASAMTGCFLLILGGKELKDDEKKLLEKYLTGRYRHFGYISMETMRMLYAIALCLVYPSFYEGFGIPVLESMRCGCPAVASDSSSLPEAGGNAVILVKNVTPEGFAEAIENFKNQIFRKAVIQRGFDHAKSFSWEKCYVETKAFYKKILNA